MADKQLESTAAASAFQKQWFADLRRRVFDERQPYALLQADVPFELFDLAGHPGGQQSVVGVARGRQAPGARRFSTRWTPTASTTVSAATAASATPRRAIAKRGEPPWGGLPTPRLLCARLTCDCIHRVFALWAEAFGAELFEIDHPGAGELPPRWWELGAASMARARRAASARVRRLRRCERLVERLESISGRRLDRDALRERLERVNRQEEIFDAARR